MQFSWTTFLLLFAIAAVTFAMTEFLAARWTTYRRYFVLRDWAATRHLRLIRNGRGIDQLPERLQKLEPPLRIRWHFTDGRLALLRAQRGAATHNLLLTKIVKPWPAAALRSTRSDRSLLDDFGLFNYPSVYGIERFTLHGEDPAAARRLSESAIRGLLPRDLSIVLDGDVMLIDFSTRPFDPIELERVVTLAQQLTVAVPVGRA